MTAGDILRIATKRLLSIVSLFALFGSMSAPGQSNETPPSAARVLNAGGEVLRPLKLTVADLAKLPRQNVSARDHDGNQATFEGVALADILQARWVRQVVALTVHNL